MPSALRRFRLCFAFLLVLPGFAGAKSVIVSPASFVASINNEEWTRGNANDDLVGLGGFVAPVPIQGDASITSVTWYVSDNGTQEVCLYLISKDIATDIQTLLGTQCTTGAVVGVQKLTFTISSGVIGDTVEAFFQIILPEESGVYRLIGIKVKYDKL